MEYFSYKEYTDEENKIYAEAMNRIMEGLRNGLNFTDACKTADIEDEELRGYIEDDTLKVIIADMHYVKGLSLQNIADTLQISMDKIQKADAEMMEDVEIASMEIHRMNNPGRPFGNA
jgi:hypothetical protein